MAKEHLTRRQFLGNCLFSGFALSEAIGNLPATAQHTALPVVIDCRRLLGSAEQISDFLGAGGALDSVADNLNDPVTRLNITHISFSWTRALVGHQEVLWSRW